MGFSFVDAATPVWVNVPECPLPDPRRYHLLQLVDVQAEVQIQVQGQVHQMDQKQGQVVPLGSVTMVPQSYASSITGHRNLQC